MSPTRRQIRHIRRRLRSRAARRVRGFSLVEILVALAVFALGIAGILALFGTATFIAHETIDTVKVHHLVEEIATHVQTSFREYAPVGFPYSMYGYPERWLEANNDRVPAQATQIRIPYYWPGGLEPRPDMDLTEVYVRPELPYAIHYTPLTNTIDPNSGRPQCVLATITVYWTRAGSTYTFETNRVILLPQLGVSDVDEALERANEEEPDLFGNPWSD